LTKPNKEKQNEEKNDINEINEIDKILVGSTESSIFEDRFGTISTLQQCDRKIS